MPNLLSLRGPKTHLPPIPTQDLFTKLRSDSVCRLPGSAL